MEKVLFWLAVIALLGMIFAQTGSAEAPLDDAIVRYNESTNDSISVNSSSLQAKEHSIISQASRIIVIGKGYYAAHPIGYSSQFGKQTWLKNRAIGVSMNHEVASAHNMNQTLEMSARDSRQEDELGISGYSGIQMKVNEDVQEGKVSIGVLQGGTAEIGQTPSASALRKPLIMIDEEYVGTFHIEKNMSIQAPIKQIWTNYSWLPCCTGHYFDRAYSSREFLSGANIFDYRNYNSIFSA
jgi:hypothetical protein